MQRTSKGMTNSKDPKICLIICINEISEFASQKWRYMVES